MYASMVLRDGIEVGINKKEYETIIPKIRMTANVKMYRNPEGHYIVLSPSNLQMIKYYGDESDEPKPYVKQEKVETKVVEKPKVEEKPKKRTPEELAIIAEVEGKLPKETIPTVDAEEKKDPLAEMIEKSNCKHESSKLELYRQHTAKGIRYFPVCSFCGKRERYISEAKILEGAYAGTPNEKWTEDDIVNAKVWVD